MGEIDRADPGARRIAIVIVLVAGLVGSAFIVAVGGSGGEFQAWASENILILVERPWLAAVLAAAMMAPVAAFALYVGRYGADVIRSERFPLAGQEVVRDTPVRFGAEAVRHGRILRGLAALLLAGCAALPYFFWRIFDSLAA